MMKYQAMTELMSPRPTDLSNLELGHMDNSGGELDLLLNVLAGDMASLGHTSMYCTIDSRRMAGRAKKNQQDRSVILHVYEHLGIGE